MDINKIAGGNIIPKGASEAFKKTIEETASIQNKPQEIKNQQEQDKGARLDVQA